MFRPAKAQVDERLAELRDHFDTYLQVFTDSPSFRVERLRSHLRTLKLIHNSSSANEAARNETVAESLREVLQLWGIGSRGTMIAPPPTFNAELREIAPLLTPLERLQVDTLGETACSVADAIWQIISRLEIVTRNGQPVQNKVVSGTKTLHHLLPDLVVPFDREYTQSFFGWKSEFQNHPEDCFRFAFRRIGALARAVNPAQYVGSGWNSSRSVGAGQGGN